MYARNYYSHSYILGMASIILRAKIDQKKAARNIVPLSSSANLNKFIPASKAAKIKLCNTMQRYKFSTVSQ